MINRVAAGSVPVDLVNTVLAARRFYLDGLSKSDIADELGISRFKVSRLLDAARRDGIVRITVEVPADVDLHLSGELAEVYGIRQALVVRVLDDAEDVVRLQLGRAAAALLAGSLTASDVLGLSWGKTLYSLVASLDGLPPCTVVQIVGGVPANLDVSSMELVRRLAARASGPVYPLHVPMLLGTPQAAQALRDEPQVRATFAMFGRLTRAVVGIGAWEPEAEAMSRALDRRQIEQARRAGVVADVCMTLLDERGVPVAVEGVSDRVIAIDTGTLSRVPEVVALAGGRVKARAVAAALRSGLVHRLVTDELCAAELLRLAAAGGPAGSPRPSLLE